MKVNEEARKKILNRTLSEVAQRSILECRARRPFNLLLAGQAERSKIDAACELVDRDGVHCYGVDRFSVSSYAKLLTFDKPSAYSVSWKGFICQRQFCDLGVHCSCKDHIHRGVKCKHILAVELWKLSGGQ